MTVQSLRPYADLSGIFFKIEYRANPTVAFAELDAASGAAHQIVRVDDLRSIPRHEFKVSLNEARLKPIYEQHRADISLVILTRDTMLRKEVVLARHPIDSLPAVIAIRPADLLSTGHRDRLPIEFVVVAGPVFRGPKTVPTQRASRLAEFHVTLVNATGGAAFPYRRATAEEFTKLGLPEETVAHLDLRGDAAELFQEVDTPVEQLFTVMVNDKVWDAMQSDRGRSSSQLRMVAVTEMTAMLILSAARAAMKSGDKIQQGSVIDQLLGFIAKQTWQNIGDMRERLDGKAGVHEIAPFVQAAFRYATIASKASDEEEVA